MKNEVFEKVYYGRDHVRKFHLYETLEDAKKNCYYPFERIIEVYNSYYINEFQGYAIKDLHGYIL